MSLGLTQRLQSAGRQPDRRALWGSDMRNLLTVGAVAVAVLVGVGCDCLSGGLRGTAPVASVTTSDELGVVEVERGLRYALDFGEVEVGRRAERHIEIRNLGDATLLVDAVAIEGNVVAAFTASPPSLSISVGSADHIKIAFLPLDATSSTATLVFETNDDEAPRIEVALTGSGFVPEVEVTPRELDFGVVPIEQVLALEVVVSSRSNSPLLVKVQPVYPSGMADVFSVTWPGREDDDSFILDPGESRALAVAFSPAVTGSHSASFGIKACETCHALQVVLLGTALATALVVEPSTLEFGPVNPGRTISKPVSFGNVGHLPLDLTSLSILALGGEEVDGVFELVDAGVPLEVPSRDEKEVLVAFTPPDLDEHVAMLAWESTDPRSQAGQVTLIGQGGGPGIDIEPREVDFGEGSFGMTLTRTVHIGNPGHETTSVDGWSVEGEGFALVDDPGPVSLAVGDMLPVTVAFSPEALGEARGRLSVQSNVRHEPEAFVDLRGASVDLGACVLEVIPDAIRFGLLAPQRPARLPLTLHNLGEEVCLVRDLEISADSSAAFFLVAGGLETLLLEPGERHQTEVAFVPGEEGDYEGEIVFQVSSFEQSRRSVPLLGSRGHASQRLLPEVLDFGVVGAECPLRVRDFCVVNEHWPPVTITALDVLGAAGEGTFHVLDKPPDLGSEGVLVEAADRTCFQVVYEPAETGEHLDAIVMELAEREEPLVLRLEGIASLEGHDEELDGFGCLHGRVCAPSGDRWLPDASVRLAIEDDDGIVIGEMNTSTDEAGFFTLTHVPAGAHRLEIEKGSFTAVAPVEITDGRVTHLAEHVCVDKESAAVALVHGSGSIETLLAKLGLDNMSLYASPEELLDGDIGQYKIVILDGGWGSSSSNTPERLEALRRWVDAGGSLFAMEGHMYSTVQPGWSPLIVYSIQDPHHQYGNLVTLDILDPGMESYIGQSQVLGWRYHGMLMAFDPSLELEVLVTASRPDWRWEVCDPCYSPSDHRYDGPYYSCLEPVAEEPPEDGWPYCSYCDPPYWCIECRCPASSSTGMYGPPDEHESVLMFHYGLGTVAYTWMNPRAPDRPHTRDQDMIFEYLFFQL